MDTLNAAAHKRYIRQQMRLARYQKNEDSRSTASWRVTNHIRQVIALHQPQMVGIYMPIHDEINLQPLLNDLRHNNNLEVEFALPRVAYKGAPLVFNRWYVGARLDYDKFGIDCAVGPEVQPGLIVIPTLAFDRKGGRIGYGGGYYDRTLKTMTMPAITIAVAYSDQEIEQVPMEYHDQRVDYVATERELIVCR